MMHGVIYSETVRRAEGEFAACIGAVSIPYLTGYLNIVELGHFA